MLVLFFAVGSSSFRYLHRIGSSQITKFMFGALASRHPILSHPCAHSAPPFSCLEGDLTLPLQASAINGKIFQQPSYNKCTCPVFCSIQDFIFSAFQCNSNNTIKSVGGIEFL